jgi:hypothetical protein
MASAAEQMAANISLANFAKATDSRSGCGSRSAR